MSTTRRFPATALAVAISLTFVWGAPSPGAKPPKPSPPPPNAPGTVYYIVLEDIYGMNADGTDKQLVFPREFKGDFWSERNRGPEPSNLVYGSDNFFNRWWLVVKTDGRTYDQGIYPNQTRRDVPHKELFAIRTFVDVDESISYVEVKLTDLFGSLIVRELPRYSNDGLDSFVSFVADDVSLGYSEDEFGRTSVDFNLAVRDRLYRINFGSADIGDVAGIIFAGAPRFSISDLDPIEGFTKPYTSSYPSSYQWSPDGQRFIYNSDSGLFVWDVPSATPQVLLPEDRTLCFQWSRVTNRILFNRAAFAVVNGIYSMRPDGTDLWLVLQNGGNRGWWEKPAGPLWAPDGLTFLYHVQSDKFNVRKSYIYRLPYPPGHSEPFLLTGDTDELVGKWPAAWVSNNTP